MAEQTAPSLVLLYDGVCGFCNKTVQMILKHDRRGELMFAPLQSRFGREVVERHPELEGVDSVVLVEKDAATGEEKLYVRSAASLRLARYLGGLWRLALAARAVPAPVRDFLYDAVARNRYKFFGKHESCLLPDAEVRSRFLDA